MMPRKAGPTPPRTSLRGPVFLFKPEREAFVRETVEAAAALPD